MTTRIGKNLEETTDKNEEIKLFKYLDANDYYFDTKIVSFQAFFLLLRFSNVSWICSLLHAASIHTSIRLTRLVEFDVMQAIFFFGSASVFSIFGRYHLVSSNLIYYDKLIKKKTIIETERRSKGGLAALVVLRPFVID